MPTQVFRSPVGAGKTETTIRHLLDHLDDTEHRFGRAIVLLPTSRQELSYRQRIVDIAPTQSVFFNIELENFYQLSSRILHTANIPSFRINQSTQTGLLRSLLRELAENGELVLYTEIAHTPGFVQIVADLIRELKQNLVDPKAFVDAAKTQKDHELAHIYSAYQNTLIQHDLVDIEGEGWLALATLQEQPDLLSNTRMLVVDGYDQFTPLQAALVAGLSQRIDETIVTLTRVPGRETSIGQRFERALNTLQHAHQEASVPLNIVDLPPTTDNRPSALQYLTQNILLNDVERVEPSDNIEMIAVPEPAEEVAAVSRRIKSLLLSGSPPESIVVMVRDWNRYAQHFDHYGDYYELPLLLHQPSSLENNPLVHILFAALNLHYNNFPRKAVLDVLRSPYINVPGLSSEWVGLLDRVSLQQQVTAGVSEWLEAIEKSNQTWGDEAEEELVPLLTLEEVSILSTSLETFFNYLQPLPHDTVAGYVHWVDDLIGDITEPVTEDELDEQDTFSLGIMQAVEPANYEGLAPKVLNRDVSALQAIKDVLRGMLDSQVILDTTIRNAPPRVSWQQFFHDFRAALKYQRERERVPSRSGQVLVTTVANARGLPHRHGFILGLSEGLFPAQPAEEPLYLDSERKWLTQNGVRLQTRAERSDDDGLFYELMSLPSDSLTVSRPTIMDGKPWAESHLWTAVQAVYTDLPITQYRVGEVLPAHLTANTAETLVSVIADLSDTNQKQDIHPIMRWLRVNPNDADKLEQVMHGIVIEHKRLSRLPNDKYSGVIEHPDLRETIRTILGSERVWSASQFNEYGICAFRFFAKRLLRT